MTSPAVLRARRIAGVALVASSCAFPPLLPAQPLWSVRLDADDAPIAELGAAILTGTDVLVFDGDAGRIVRIDRTGKAVQRIGAKGRGPGELLSVSWMGLGANDSLYVWDDRQRRLSVFAASGRFVRSESPEHGADQPGVFGRLRDGRWLVVSQTEKPLREGGVDVTQSLLQVGIARTVREAPKTLTSLPSRKFVAVRLANGVFDMRELPAAEMTYLAACEQGFLVGAGGAREVRAYDATGALLATVRPQRPVRLLSGAARQSLIENWAGVHKGKGLPTDPATAAAFVKAFDAILPKQAPMGEQFVVGSDRSLWLAPDTLGLGWQRVGEDGVGRPGLTFGDDGFLLAATAEHALVKFYGNDERLELWPRPAALRGVRAGLPASLGRCSGALVR